MNESKTRRVCETCRKYRAIPDRCRDGKDVRGPAIRREGCELWEREDSRRNERTET